MGSSTIPTRIVVWQLGWPSFYGWRTQSPGCCCDGKKWPMALVSRNSLFWSGFTMFHIRSLIFESLDRTVPPSNAVNSSGVKFLWHQPCVEKIHPRFPPGVLLDFIWRHCSSLDFYQDHHQTKLGKGGRFEEGFSGCDFFVCFSCSSKVVRMDVHLWLCLILGCLFFFPAFKRERELGRIEQRKMLCWGCADSDEQMSCWDDDDVPH